MKCDDLLKPAKRLQCVLLLALNLVACTSIAQEAQHGTVMDQHTQEAIMASEIDHQPRAVDAVNLPRSMQWLMSPDDMGAPYLIQVSQPPGPVPETGYAVLYVLDGNARFPLMVAARDTLMRHGPHDPGLPLLIVGIGYPDTVDFNVQRRASDYLPVLASSEAGVLSETGVPSETGVSSDNEVPQGAARFLAFIQSTLKPCIEQQYPINHAQETLFGHSYGGLFTLYTLLNHPESFDHYMALSPSLWWHDGALKPTIAAFKTAQTKGNVLIGVGALEQMPAHNIDPERANRIKAYAMVDNARWASQQLQQSGLASVRFQRYADAHHGSVLWPGARSLMQWLQSLYEPKP